MVDSIATGNIKYLYYLLKYWFLLLFFDSHAPLRREVASSDYYCRLTIAPESQSTYNIGILPVKNLLLLLFL